MPKLKDYVEHIKPELSEMVSTEDTFSSQPDVETAFLDVQVDDSTIVNMTTKERAWAFSGSLGCEEDHVLVLHRWKIWWAIPRLLKGSEGERRAPPQTYLLLGKLKGSGKYLALLPLIDSNMGFSLEGLDGKSALALSGYDNSPRSEEALQREVEANRAAGGTTKRRALVLARGADPFAAVGVAFKIAKRHMRAQLGVQEGQHTAPSKHDKGSNRHSWHRGPGPDFVDALGWCSWDSFYTDLSHQRVLAGLASFNETGVTPRFVILDDGWQNTNVDDAANGKQWGGRLSSFSANFKFAPGYSAESEAKAEAEAEAGEVGEVGGVLSGSLAAGVDSTSHHSLTNVVAAARAQHNVKHFLVWHTLTGYWAGVDPLSPAMARFNAKVLFPSIPESVHRASVADALKAEPFTVKGVGLVHPESAAAFFSGYHAALAASGVDGVKVDAQAVLALMRDDAEGDRGGGWGLVTAYHTALKKSIGDNFGGSGGGNSVIHCMCHAQDTLLSILALYPDEDDGEGEGEGKKEMGRGRPVVRGSDDYWPADAASHGPHLYANAMNSLLFSQVGVHDWDMFQTARGRSSLLHAASRAVSGGPVYVSDQPGKHDATILRRLAFADGAIPRCVRSARPSAKGLFLDPQRHAGHPLLIQNINPAGGLVVAAFSIAGAVLEDDKEQFRFTSPGETSWSHAGWQEDVQRWEREHPLPADHSPRNNTPFYDDAAWAARLGITWSVGAVDVEEGRRAIDLFLSPSPGPGQADRPRWVAFRASDRQLYAAAAAEVGVPIFLQRVFDFDVVSFAPVLTPPTPLGVEAETEQQWAAVLGAVDMLNPGGAVLGSSVSAWRGVDPAATGKEAEESEAGVGSERLAEGMKLNLELLGEGTYWVVHGGRTGGGSTACRAHLSSAHTLSPLSDQPPASASASASASVSVSVSCRAVQLIVQAETGATEEASLVEVVVVKAQAEAQDGSQQRGEPSGARVSILLL